MAHEGGRQSDSIDPASFSSLGLSDARPSRGAVTGHEASFAPSIIRTFRRRLYPSKRPFEFSIRALLNRPFQSLALAVAR